MNRTLVIGLAALLVLALGVGVALRQFGPRRAAEPAATAVAPIPEEPGPGVVEEAMRSAPLDSTEIKSRWQDEVRGVDVSGLDVKQQELFLRFANAEHCTCGCGYTLAGCKASDMSCEVSGGMLEALRDSIRSGKVRSARGIRARPPHAG